MDDEVVINMLKKRKIADSADFGFSGSHVAATKTGAPGRHGAA